VRGEIILIIQLKLERDKKGVSIYHCNIRAEVHTATRIFLSNRGISLHLKKSRQIIAEKWDGGSIISVQNIIFNWAEGNLAHRLTMLCLE
jgi:hypothetical protein